MTSPSPPAARPIRVSIPCAGVGGQRRATERFARECAEALADDPRVDVAVLAGRAERAGFPGWWMPRIIARRPDVVCFTDPRLGRMCHSWRRMSGQRFQLLYVNLASAPAPNHADFVQQPTAAALAEATARCERTARHFVLPPGVRVPATLPPMLDGAARAALGLPADRPVVLAVGTIGAAHTRMDYLVTEIAALPEPRPFLCLLGDDGPDADGVRALATSLLGAEHVMIRPVEPGTLGHFHRAADLVVFASLQHRLGRACLETVGRGVTVLAHDCAVTRELLGPYAILRDLSAAGTAARTIAAALAAPASTDARFKRWRHVRDRYGWKALRESYVDTFQRLTAAR